MVRDSGGSMWLKRHPEKSSAPGVSAVILPFSAFCGYTTCVTSSATFCGTPLAIDMALTRFNVEGRNETSVGVCASTLSQEARG